MQLQGNFALGERGRVAFAAAGSPEPKFRNLSCQPRSLNTRKTCVGSEVGHLLSGHRARIAAFVLAVSMHTGQSQTILGFVMGRVWVVYIKRSRHAMMASATRFAGLWSLAFRSCSNILLLVHRDANQTQSAFFQDLKRPALGNQKSPGASDFRHS